jgi:hypothetical protein
MRWPEGLSLRPGSLPFFSQLSELGDLDEQSFDDGVELIGFGDDALRVLMVELPLEAARRFNRSGSPVPDGSGAR